MDPNNTPQSENMPGPGSPCSAWLGREGECVGCLEIGTLLPVRFMAAGSPREGDAVSMCYRCRTGGGARYDHAEARYAMPYDHWVHLPRVWQDAAP